MSLDFDGSNDYVKINNSASLNAISTVFSVGAWINTNSVAQSAQFIIQKYPGPTSVGEFHLYIRSNDEIAVYTPESGVVETVSLNLSPSTWYWIVATYDGTTLRIFVDGVQKQSSVVSINIADAN